MPQPANKFSGIFISYRRNDSAGYAGRLLDRLSAHFGEDHVFMDIDHIRPADDFVEIIENAVGSCEVLLAVIGKRWLSSTDGTSRRIESPNDFVRLEIIAALQRKIPVLPVLVEGATMPRSQDLPDELRSLSRRQALELSDLRWRHDVSRLIATLEKILAERKDARAEEERRTREEERQRLAAEEEQRRLEEERRRKLEAEEQRQREEAVARAAQEQKEREVEEERRRKAEAQRAKELEPKRREAEPSATPPAQTPARQPSPEDLKRARPSAINHRLLVAAAVFAVLVAGVAAVWWLGAGNTTPNISTPRLANTPGTGEPQPSPALPVAPEGMAYVPGGEFQMGRNDGDEYERPAHPVTVAPFFIDKYEVTREEYQKFVEATGSQALRGWKDKKFPDGMGRLPVTGVTWKDADAFCQFRDKRLPTEAEWELAARGPKGLRYPWGNDWVAGAANADGASTGLVNVGSYPQGKSPFGVLDMVGNAWEWTATDLSPYRKGAQVGRLPVAAAAGMKVIRGCMYSCNKAQATTTHRRGWPAAGDYDYGNTGFRCVEDETR